MKKTLLVMAGILACSSVLANTYCPASVSCNIQPNGKTTCTGLDSSWKVEVNPLFQGQYNNISLAAIHATTNDMKDTNKKYHLYCFYNASGEIGNNNYFYIYQSTPRVVGGSNWVASKQWPQVQKDCSPLSIANCYTQ